MTKSKIDFFRRLLLSVLCFGLIVGASVPVFASEANSSAEQVESKQVGSVEDALNKLKALINEREELLNDEEKNQVRIDEIDLELSKMDIESLLNQPVKAPSPADLRIQDEITIETKERPIRKNAFSVIDPMQTSIKQSLWIEGQKNNLFPTFDHLELAVAFTKSQIPDLIALLQKHYPLPEFDQNTCEEYLAKGHEYYSKPDDERIPSTEELSMQFTILQTFVSSYTVEQTNREITDYVENSEYFTLDELALQLPFSTPLYREKEESFILTPMLTEQQNLMQRSQAFDIKKATAYAKKHATSRNSHAYGSLNSDCTNFASQILRAGIANQHSKFPDVNSGWWHESIVITYTPIYIAHYYSRSWTSVNKFKAFMGSNYNTKSFYNFSQTVRAGDFIAVDFQNDEEIDHAGYVTALGTTQTYNGKYYRDFVVAQHTKDYNKWVSDDYNGWENSDGKGRYYIIRRKV